MQFIFNSNMILIKCLFIVLLIGLCRTSSFISSGVLVTVPKFLLTNSKEKICVSVHDRGTVTPVKIVLSAADNDEVITSVEDFIKGNSSCVMLYIPLTDKTEGKIQVRFSPYGENSIPYFSESKVEIKQDPLITIIAVEKPVYRPGEIIRFRILCLTHKLKVYKNKLQRVWIESPNGITIEQWLNVKTNLGLTQFEFNLSEESLLGDWKIKVQHFDKNDFIEKKTFSVKEYILPWFEVNIKQPKEILADTEIVSFEVCAKYSYGAPVKGQVKLELKIKSKYHHSGVERPKVNLESKLDPWTGCSILNATGAELFLSDSVVQPEKIRVSAVVTESASKKSEKTNATLDISYSAVKLKFHCSEYFKPGLPYKGKLRVLSPSSQPIVAVDLPIQICMKEGGLYGAVDRQCWNYSTDYSSEVVFTLPPRPNTTNLISLTAISLNHPNRYYDSERWRLLMVQPKAKQDLKPWFSPSKSFMDVATVSPVICNSEHSLHVQYTVKNFSDITPTFYYLVESRGDLLRIGSVKPDSEKELVGKVSVGFPPARAFILRVVITPDMSPESRIVVYYVRSDGEIVAASTVLSVDRCFPNMVRARWSEKEVQPGANVSLIVRAHPSSLCAINVIDSILTKNNFNKTLTSDTIWEKLEYYKTPFLKDTTDYCKLPTVPDVLAPPGTDLRRRKRNLDRSKRWYLLPSEYEHVDAITAFNDIGVIVMTDLTLETRPCPSISESSSLFKYDLRSSSIPIPLSLDSNAISNNHNKNDDSAKTKLNRSNIRYLFPEAWLWSVININNIGEMVLNTNAPHSITSWDANVFCVHDEAGFGMSDPISMVTFLPFFLKVNSPKSFIRTETLPINVTVYNYLGHSLPVKILFKTSDGLQVVSQSELRDCITELSPMSFNFSIKADKIGSFNITVTAEILPELDNCKPAVYQGMSDTVIKPVKVLAEGYKVSKSYSALFCANDELKSPWSLSLPGNVIRNTARAKVTISPGLLGPALQGLGDFLEMPTGCGEQNMIRLAPNIHILRYIDAANIPNSEKLKEKAKNNIKKGYQRQLQYRHPDGSYSAFGPKNLMENEEASIWLTAFVISSFGQASNVITIDTVALQESVKWITSKQLENGCFPLIGQVYTKELKGGLEETESTAALTAYIISALYKSGLPISPSIASNAEFCLSAEHSNSDVYSLALITYAFSIINSTSHKTQHNLLELIQMAKHDQDFIWWEKEGGSLALNIEITGYVVLSLLKVGGTNNIVTAQAAIRWISTNRNYKGGFISTQDTVIGLEALTTFAMTIPATNVISLFVSIIENINNEFIKHTFTIENNNHELQQYVNIRNIPTVLNIHTRGEGCALIQATLKYNVDEDLSGDAFDVSVYTNPISVFDACYFRDMEICVQYKLPDAVSNMVIVVINFESGYSPDRSSLNEIVGIKRWEEDQDENKLIVYLDKVESTPKCFHIIIQRLFNVYNPAPAIITVTDYYHPERRKSVNYTIVCDEDVMLLDSPDSSTMNFKNFQNVDHELNVPDGIEGPEPSYACPDTNPNCRLPLNTMKQSSYEAPSSLSTNSID